MASNLHFISKIEKAPKIPTLVAQQIIKLISDGKLKPGDKLPSEQKMTKLFGISRISLREAMKLLEAKGYIESLDKRGKFIRIPSEPVRSPIEDLLTVDPEKIWELLNVRKILDSEAAACACKRATKNQRRTLNRLMEKAHELGPDSVLDNVREGGRLYTKFFDILIESTQNAIFVYLRKSLNTILTGAFPFSMKKLSLIEESSRKIVQQLSAISSAIQEGDPDAARTAMIEHIDYIEKSLRKALNRSNHS